MNSILAKFLIVGVVLSAMEASMAGSRTGQFSFQAFWETIQGRAHEVVALGIPASEFQQAFNTFAKEGLELFLIDGYDLGGQAYINSIFRTPTGEKWAARHGLSAQEYQTEVEKYLRDGKYCLRWVDSYRAGNSIRYAAVFTRYNCARQVAYHGYTANQHQDRFQKLERDGWEPINVSVVSLNGQRYYTAFYEKRQSSYALKSFLTRDQFEEVSAQQRAAGRRLAYMNAYTHDQNILPRFVAIWRSGIGDGEYLPNVYGPTMMEKGDSWGRKGYYTRFVTGYGVGSGHRFDAFWYKPQRAVSDPGKAPR